MSYGVLDIAKVPYDVGRKPLLNLSREMSPVGTKQPDPILPRRTTNEALSGSGKRAHYVTTGVASRGEDRRQGYPLELHYCY